MIKGFPVHIELFMFVFVNFWGGVINEVVFYFDFSSQFHFGLNGCPKCIFIAPLRELVLTFGCFNIGTETIILSAICIHCVSASAILILIQ